MCQLHSGIELRLKDEAKYARWQEFRNMNPTTGMPRVSDTIFRNVDEICKKYLTPNSLALQRKQMVESLLYRTWIKEVENIYLLVRICIIYDFMVWFVINITININ